MSNACQSQKSGVSSTCCNAMLTTEGTLNDQQECRAADSRRARAGKVKFAQGIKAGRWVFATGVMAQDFKNGIAPDVLSERALHVGLPKREKEALRIWENIDAVLRAAGTDRTNLVRTDQYYATVKAVPAYQQVRREFLAGRVAPSTSITQQGLLLPGADMNIQALASPAPGFEVTHLKNQHLAGRPTAGFSPR